MSDREVRSRKKRKGALEKGAADEGSKEKYKALKHSDSEFEDDVSSSEPSATARVTFLVVFFVLAVMVVAVFLALQSSSFNGYYDDVEPETSEQFIVPEVEPELGNQHYATDVEESSEAEPDIQSNEQSINLGAFNIDSTEPLQSSEHIMPETTQASTPHHVEASSAPHPPQLPTGQATLEATSSPPSETELLRSTEIWQSSETSDIKLDESAPAVSLEATRASEASSPTASQMATSTLETMAMRPAPDGEQAAITNEYDQKIHQDLTESEELLEKEPDDIFWDL